MNLKKQSRIQSTQQDGESLSSPEQNTSFKKTQHKNLKDKETNTLNHNVQYLEAHNDRRDGSPTSSNQFTQDNIDQSQPHPQLIHLWRTNKIHYNEDSSSNLTITNIKQHNQQKYEEEDTS